MSRAPFYLLVGVLMLAGIVMTVYRHIEFDVPWTPGEQREVWEVEAQVNFFANGGPIKVNLALPSHQENFRVLTENTASSGYGLSFLDDDAGRRAQWAIREASGSQQLYYSVQLLVAPDAEAPSIQPPAIPQDIAWERPYDTAAQGIIARAHQQSADAFTFARELIQDFSGDRQDENARLLLNRFDRPALLVRLLNQAGIAAREVDGLMLEDGRRRQALSSWLQVFDEDGDWVILNPATGEQGRPDNLLLWEASGQPVLEVQGGSNSRVSFSMLKHNEPAAVAVRNQLMNNTLLNFSIHSLPLEEQSLFKTILLIPIGALVVVLLRVLVGIKTSGTFMPVLIALAFIQTSLFTGLVGFLLVVAVGLVIRSYLSHLNLLLVARVSAVIITVIAIISLFSVVAYRMGLNAGLTITFFPMIILSWTIERMSILWEEEGPKQVLIQGGGSLLTAVLAYLAMNNPWIRHITFNFLGVQLILMAFILLLGNYTGYRLLELRRFKPITED
ncbi:inactive transglutaminase family protein [Halomonas sp. McH1-25]|uniref:inactive transglutaminase family protein n=1 Tax=unclassified Halomonas TaxID=2609666 RepID=UPI001EF6FFDA|nr:MULTISPECIES: inactive transglutaminase family protein [unclassified Halomonas]MCG7598462.1 inactive transglutaminase family protein [Halomonas sp. McH1-25]MCP1343457.1 inactive transglutaminase family protein [Halomonas sp. FL8]MCP1361371.1 inactive transglutaminase family protein [Halomonas sp. BBD45]MCP1365510.1 inactive transglutaminase family protein [Halomonas sp. BBD48]